MARGPWLTWLVLFLAALGLGCGKSYPGATGQSSSQDATERNASLRQSVDLVGIWLGRAVLDQAEFQSFLDGISDPDERLRIAEMEQSFASVSIAMEFRSDSTMEIEIEILPGNAPPIRESTLGTWKVVSFDETSVSVRCSESLEDGRVEEQVLRYKLSDDKNVLTTEAPVGEELRPFRPRFEFERRIESKVADLPNDERTIIR